MKVTAKQYALVLMQMTDGKSGKGLESAVKEFVAALRSRHELSSWRAIVRAFDHAWKRKYGAATVHLTTAYPVSKTLRQEIEKAFPKASVTESVEPELLGGAILQIDDRRYDGSVLSQLHQIFD